MEPDKERFWNVFTTNDSAYEVTLRLTKGGRRPKKNQKLNECIEKNTDVIPLDMPQFDQPLYIYIYIFAIFIEIFFRRPIMLSALRVVSIHSDSA